MSNRRSSRPPRRSRREWKKLVQAWKRSRLSQAEFCRRYGLTYSTFNNWRSRLAAEEGPPQPAFVPVTITAQKEAGSQKRAGFEIRCPRGHAVLVTPGFSPTELESILQMLEALPC